MKQLSRVGAADKRGATLLASGVASEAERLSRHHPPSTRSWKAEETVFSNGWLVLADEVVWGSLVVRGGEVAEIGSGSSHVAGAIDLEGDMLLPGLVDLHTDNLERHLQPRPGVAWPTMTALLAHDRQMAAAGITTVFDSLCVGDQFEGRTGREDALAQAVAAMEGARADGLFTCEHFLHLRCEVSSLGAAAAFAAYVGHSFVRLASLMDHTPGQRQWRRLDKWEEVNGKRMLPGTDLDALVARRQAQQIHAADTRREVAALARARGIALASHDDTTDDHVEEAVADGVTISEFPTTSAAAAAARRHRLAIVMGAPNVVLGGSHSGNVSARDLATVGLVDGLASDYVPASLLQACFVLHDVHGTPLPRAVAMATRNPTVMVGLNDRGELAAGKRADLVWVRMHRRMPVVRGVWSRGKRLV